MITSQNKFNFWQIVVQAMNWFTRRRDKPLLILRLLFTSSFLYLGGRVLYLSINIEQFQLDIKLTEGTSIQYLDYITLVLFLISVAGLITEYILSKLQAKRKKTILIDFQGMDECLSNPLQSVVEKKYPRVTTYEINTLPYMRGRSVENPEKALEEIIRQIESAKKGVGKSNPTDVSFVFGGLAPVPFGFVTGYLFSNKNNIETWDYNRDESAKNGWHSLDKAQNIEVPYFEYQKGFSEEVCVIISISFSIDAEIVKNKFPGLAIITAAARIHTNDNVSSKGAQETMQRRFRELLIELKARGVKKVHIFSAAQSSLNFNLGRQIDGNHPQCVVYQYEPSASDPYPWGILVNDRAQRDPYIVDNH